MNDDCLKLTTYFGERDRTEHGLVCRRADGCLRRPSPAGEHPAARRRGVRRLQHLHTDRLLTLSEDLPVVSIAVDERQRIEPLLGAADAGQAQGPDHARARAAAVGRDRAGRAARAARRGDEADRLRRSPGARRPRRRRTSPSATCCIDAGIAGASVLLGVDGTRRGRPCPRDVLRSQRRRADDDHRGRLGRADRRACCPSSAQLLRRAADHARARPRLQARRRAAGRARTSCPAPTSTGSRCGRS